jgi:hypothetical protein
MTDAALVFTVSIGGGNIESVGDSSDEGAESVDKDDAGGAASIFADGVGRGKVPSVSDGVLQRRDHIDAIVVDGAAASVIVVAGTIVTAVATVAVTAYACAAAVEGAAAVDVTVASVASKIMEAMNSVSVADAGVVTDEVAGTEMSSGGAVSFIEGAIGTGFTSLSVLFISSDWTAGIAAAVRGQSSLVLEIKYFFLQHSIQNENFQLLNFFWTIVR